MIAPQQLRAEVPQEQMDGVMGKASKKRWMIHRFQTWIAEGRIVVHICHATAAGGI